MEDYFNQQRSHFAEASDIFAHHETFGLDVWGSFCSKKLLETLKRSQGTTNIKVPCIETIIPLDTGAHKPPKNLVMVSTLETYLYIYIFIYLFIYIYIYIYIRMFNADLPTNSEIYIKLCLFQALPGMQLQDCTKLMAGEYP